LVGDGNSWMGRWEFMNGVMGIYEWSYGNWWMKICEFMNGVMGIYGLRDGYL